MSIESTLFPVKEIPAIQYPNPSDELNQEEYKKTGYKFIVREDTNQVLSCMTDEYKLVPNSDIIKAAEPIIKHLTIYELVNSYLTLILLRQLNQS